jgi:hypothetical protein
MIVPHWLAQALRLRAAGWSLAQIARDVNAPQSTVAEWLGGTDGRA